jgi:hypothetical protein
MTSETLQDLTTPGKDLGTEILRVKDKEEDRIQSLIDDMFVDTMSQRRNIIRYRTQYQGMDLDFYNVFKYDRNKTPEEDLPGLTSMMIYNFTEIVTARFFSAYVNESGEYAKGLPQRIRAIEAAKGFTHLFNYYLRQNKEIKAIFYDLFRGTALDGVSITRQFWNYKQTTVDVSRQPRLKFNPGNKQFEIKNDLTIKRSIPLVDRPEFDYVDPLFFGVPKGTKYLNREGSGQICVEKQLFYRHELLALEKRGFLEGFKALKRNDFTGKTGYIAPEMSDFYRDLFESDMNMGLEWDDPYYRVWVDKIFEAANEESDITNYWMVNGHIIRKAHWEGGHELPYVIHTYTPANASWMGMGVGEIVQDNYRELNLIMRLALAHARKSGKISLLYPKNANLSQSDASKFTKEGGMIGYDDADSPFPPSQRFLPFNLGGSAELLFKQREVLEQQAIQSLGIGLPEIAGADLPSGFRSGKLVAGLSAQGSRPGQMKVSMMGESLSRVFEQMKHMIYRLQDEPVEVYLDDANSPILTVGLEVLERLPDVMVVPNGATKQISADVFQTLIQMLPFMQANSIPGGSSYQFGKLLDYILEQGLGNDVAKQLDALKAPPQAQFGPLPPNNQVQNPPPIGA